MEQNFLLNPDSPPIPGPIPTKQNVLFFWCVTIITIPLLAGLLLMLLSPTPLEKKPLEDTQSLTYFQDKIALIQEAYQKSNQIEKTFTGAELSAFLKSIIKEYSLKNNRGEAYFTFPQQIELNLDGQTFTLLMTLNITGIELVMSYKGIVTFHENKLLEITLTSVAFGKLPIPGTIVTILMEAGNSIIGYQLPDYITNLYLNESELTIVSIPEESPQKSTLIKRIRQRKPYQSVQETAPAAQADIRDQSSAISLSISNDTGRNDAVEEETNTQAKEEEAQKWHKLGNYFYQKQHYDLALKYYNKIIEEFPHYSNIDSIKKLAENLKTQATKQ